VVSYRVDVNANIDNADQLKQVTAKLGASLEALNAKANAFMAANQGMTINNYQAAHQLWQQGYQEMQTALSAKGVDLRTITQNYVDTDTHGAALFAR
jgi:uncharacterized protein YukE